MGVCVVRSIHCRDYACLVLYLFLCERMVMKFYEIGLFVICAVFIALMIALCLAVEGKQWMI